MTASVDKEIYFRASRLFEYYLLLCLWALSTTDLYNHQGSQNAEYYLDYSSNWLFESSP